jgi:hypothetical protein
MNELLQLYLSEVQPQLQLATAQAMYMALDKCSDVVHITDQNLNIQVSVPSVHWAQYRHSWRPGNHYGKETSSAMKD